MALGARTSPARLTPGPTQPVSDDPQLTINTNTSPVVIGDPRRPGVLVAAGRVDAPRLDCTVAVSTSGGRAWRPIDVPLPEGASNCFWPAIAFTPEGDLLVTYTPTSGPFQLPEALWLQRFDPDFEPAGAPTKVAGPLTFQPRMVVDGPTVLVAWIQAGPGRPDKALGFPPPPNPLVVARSDDGGRTFGPPSVVVNHDRLVVQPALLALGRGRVLIGALDLVDDRDTYQSTHLGLPGPPPESRWKVVTWTSTDGGTTFDRQSATVAAEVVPTQRVLIDLAPAPAFALDPRRARIYAAWESAHDVFVAHSDDAGASWSKPRQVGPSAGGQFLPGIDVAPGGRVDLAFYDRSRDPDDVMAEVVLASSWDGGRTFVHRVISEQPFDSRVGSFNGDTVMLGSHLGVLSQADRATTVWADTVRGNNVDNIVDLASATVAAEPGGSRPMPVLAVGAAVVLLGAVFTGRFWPGRAAARGRRS